MKGEVVRFVIDYVTIIKAKTQKLFVTEVYLNVFKTL